MRILVLQVVVCFVILPSIAFAAGFDCKKASTKIEKIICRDGALSEADEKLSVLYNSAIKRSNNKEELIQNQKAWLKRRNTLDANDLLQLYKDRILELSSPILIPINKINSTCDTFLKRNNIDQEDISGCRVSESGKIISLGDKTYHYALYCIAPSYSSMEERCSYPPGDETSNRNKGIAIYAQNSSSKTVQLILERGDEDLGLYSYVKPKFIDNAYGKILYLPVEVEGTGHFNNSDYFIWETTSKTWKRIDSRRWLKDLDKHLPKGSFVASGAWPDLKSMTVVTFIYQEKDPNCCPSGGTAHIDLTLKDEMLQIKSVRIDPSDK